MSQDPVESSQTQDAKDLYQSQIKRWRTFALLLGINLIALFSFVIWGIISIRDVSTDTNKSVVILERATGPESQANQAKVVDDLVIRIDCSVRTAISELLVQLNTSVTIVTDNCPDPTKDE